jgi:hypothetical protein
MASKTRQFVNEQTKVLSARAQRLRTAPAEIARSAAIRSAGAPSSSNRFFPAIPVPVQIPS